MQSQKKAASRRKPSRLSLRRRKSKPETLLNGIADDCGDNNRAYVDNQVKVETPPGLLQIHASSQGDNALSCGRSQEIGLRKSKTTDYSITREAERSKGIKPKVKGKRKRTEASSSLTRFKYSLREPFCQNRNIKNGNRLTIKRIQNKNHYGGDLYRSWCADPYPLLSEIVLAGEKKIVSHHFNTDSKKPIHNVAPTLQHSLIPRNNKLDSVPVIVPASSVPVSPLANKPGFLMSCTDSESDYDDDDARPSIGSQQVKGASSPRANKTKFELIRAHTGENENKDISESIMRKPRFQISCDDSDDDDDNGDHDRDRENKNITDGLCSKDKNKFNVLGQSAKMDSGALESTNEKNTSHLKICETDSNHDDKLSKPFKKPTFQIPFDDDDSENEQGIENNETDKNNCEITNPVLSHRRGSDVTAPRSENNEENRLDLSDKMDNTTSASNRPEFALTFTDTDSEDEVFCKSEKPLAKKPNFQMDCESDSLSLEESKGKITGERNEANFMATNQSRAEINRPKFLIACEESESDTEENMIDEESDVEKKYAAKSPNVDDLFDSPVKEKEKHSINHVASCTMESQHNERLNLQANSDQIRNNPQASDLVAPALIKASNSEELSQVSENSQSKSKQAKFSGPFECISCGYHNDDGMNCEICDHERPSSTLLWECANCLVENMPSSRKCTSCKTLRRVTDRLVKQCSQTSIVGHNSSNERDENPQSEMNVSMDERYNTICVSDEEEGYSYNVKTIHLNSDSEEDSRLFESDSFSNVNDEEDSRLLESDGCNHTHDDDDDGESEIDIDDVSIISKEQDRDDIEDKDFPLMCLICTSGVGKDCGMSLLLKCCMCNMVVHPACYSVLHNGNFTTCEDENKNGEWKCKSCFDKSLESSGRVTSSRFNSGVAPSRQKKIAQSLPLQAAVMVDISSSKENQSCPMQKLYEDCPNFRKIEALPLDQRAMYAVKSSKVDYSLLAKRRAKLLKTEGISSSKKRGKGKRKYKGRKGKRGQAKRRARSVNTENINGAIRGGRSAVFGPSSSLLRIGNQQVRSQAIGSRSFGLGIPGM